MLSVLALAMSVPLLAAQDVTLDRMLAVVNGDVVTMSDVRAARQLKLIAGAEAMTDEQVVDALIERRLTIAEVARYSPAEPPTADVQARQRAWESTLARGVTPAAALATVGMREAALTAWFRDDLRVAAYLDQRFTAAAQPTRQQAQAYFQAHAADFAVNGVTPEFASIEAEVRRRVAAERRATRIKDWIDSLKQRAEIRRL
ncbi:MAG: hypothetical protein EPO35_00570 [Acidobacteria bacterium]|nr:MAG: hypothetical protein EPO35_00570 [Acidobacteriota bacterium]